jgi:hypothetical protein
VASTASSSRAALSSSGGVALALGGDRDLSAQEIRAGALKIAESPGLGSCQEREASSIAPDWCLACGRQCAMRAAWRAGCQFGGAREEGGGGQASARLRAAGRLLELGGNVLVRAGRRLGQVPSAAVGIRRESIASASAR